MTIYLVTLTDGRTLGTMDRATALEWLDRHDADTYAEVTHY